MLRLLICGSKLGHAVVVFVASHRALVAGVRLFGAFETLFRSVTGLPILMVVQFTASFAEDDREVLDQLTALCFDVVAWVLLDLLSG